MIWHLIYQCPNVVDSSFFFLFPVRKIAVTAEKHYFLISFLFSRETWQSRLSTEIELRKNLLGYIISWENLTLTRRIEAGSAERWKTYFSFEEKEVTLRIPSGIMAFKNGSITSQNTFLDRISCRQSHDNIPKCF